jgi:CubicO group peptidase (beta-lactamase class C family)
MIGIHPPSGSIIRMPRLVILSFLFILLAGGAIAAPPKAAPPSAPLSQPLGKRPETVETILPPDVEVQHIADERVITYRDTVALVIGLVEPAGRRIFARGPAQVGNDEPVDGDTIFEIGSLTKVFTGLLLADMAHRGEVGLNDAVIKYLPLGTKLPQRGGHPMTLADLATHTSGLPDVVSNIAATDLNQPNLNMSAQQLLQSLASYELTRDVGAGYEYSDAGYELLALALINRSRGDFESLLRSRILGPLHMDNTRIALSTADKDKFSAGYNEHLQPVPHPPIPTLAGSTGMRSTANDLLTFLAANLGLDSTPLAPAMGDMLKTLRPTQYTELKVGLGWYVATLHGVEIVWLSGQTDGYRAFIGMVPKMHAGVVVLANSANTIEDIGVHLLDKETPLRKLYREVPISPGMFDNYIGRYIVNDNFYLVVTRDAGRLYIQGTGQPRAELFSEGDGKFFLRVVPAEVTFLTDAAGRAIAASMSQGGKIVLGTRVR